MIYGCNYLVAKEVLDPGYLRPKDLVLCRIGVAGILFTLLAIRVWQKIERKDYLRLILCMVCGVVINQIFFLEGLTLTNPINASLIMTILPIVVVIASHFLLKELITWHKVVGIILGAIGVCLIIAYGQKIQVTRTGIIGDLLIFLNACCFGLFLVLVKPLLLRYHAFQVMSIIFVMGTVVLIVTTGQQVTSIDWPNLPPPILIAITYVVIMTTFVTYLMNTFALKYLRASVVGAYVYLQPVVATTAALIMAKDHLSLIKIGGAILIFLGVYLVSRSTTTSSVSV
ncbi:MAG: DMT family transporter [Saprospiraceae bacterium]|nr:DMT family transporter [Saprospiraceae bacterium]